MFLNYNTNKPLVFVVAGPTTSGKTQLAIELAKKSKGVIINADSQQIYKGLSILSSQPNEIDIKKIPHKLFNFLEFNKRFSVEKWVLLTEKEIFNVIKKNQTPIIVGGTGMYLKALLNGLDVFPRVPLFVRKKAIQLMKNIGTKKFYKNLKNKNDSCVYNINPNDKNRLIRSWEIHKITNKSIYELRKKNKKRRINNNQRWKAMLQLGSINEVKKIMYKEKNSKNKNVLNTIGFNELKQYLEKKNNLEIASQNAIQATKKYAKRQHTWFKPQFLPNIIFKIEYKKNRKTSC